MKRSRVFLVTTVLLATLLWLLMAGVAGAHCDGLDGPVVTAARQALETGDINFVLVWVQAEDAQTIFEAFNQTLAVRKLGPEAMALADMYFFETLVRVHRAGEGAPYTGLKPVGREIGPVLPAADKALVDGNLEPVVGLILDAIHIGLHARFEAAMVGKNYKADDVDAGREFVEAYVSYIHYVEGLYALAAGESHGHEVEPETSPQSHEHR
ncbi:MAG: DUF6448 family protein [Candidatus Zixiibacteriota bacterium]